MFPLFPDARASSVYEIPYERLYEKGYRGILFDIDNTLTKHGAPATSDTVALFKRLHATGFRTIVISNNHEARVRSFARAVGTSYLPLAWKPFPRAYKRALKILHLTPRDCIFIGDQIFTDIAGAKSMGIKSVLVDPIAAGSGREEWQIVLKRLPEKAILFFYDKMKGRK